MIKLELNKALDSSLQSEVILHVPIEQGLITLGSRRG